MCRLWDAASEGNLADIQRIVALGADLEAGNAELFDRTLNTLIQP